MVGFLTLLLEHAHPLGLPCWKGISVTSTPLMAGRLGGSPTEDFASHGENADTRKEELWPLKLGETCHHHAGGSGTGYAV